MKTMTSIIKEDGSPVQVTIQEGNNRKNYQVSLNDYIASISFDTDEVKCFYPPVGKIPKECIDFTVIDEVLIPKRSFVYSELMILSVALATLSTSDF